VLQAAGREQAPSEVAEEAEPLRLIVPRAGEPYPREPAEGAPGNLTPSDVEGAVHHDVEGEARTGAELEHTNAPLCAVAEGDEPDAGHLLEPADAA